MGRSLPTDQRTPEWRKMFLRLARPKSSGTWYCPVHHGVGNEDDYSCDFATHDLTVEECERKELFYV